MLKLHSEGIIEVLAEGVVLSSEQDALDLFGEPEIADSRKVIIHQENIAPAFFDLRTGLAGAILQKFVNYQVQIAIVGSFQNLESKSLSAFVAESNRGKGFFFVEDLETAKRLLG